MPVAPSYRDLIKEAFIDPIRTAVVVDDEYPTLDELLANADQRQDVNTDANALQGRKRENYSRVQQILKFCRTQEPPWLVDVHDGKTPPLDREPDSATHLDHSDLLILDYHLELNSSGQKAIEILQRLAGNGHFNLVVVYTKDREEAGGGIDRTVNQIALGLACPIESLTLNAKRAENIENKLFAWEEIQVAIYKNLRDSLDEIAFLKVLEQEDVSWETVKKIPELGLLASYLNAIPENVKLRADEIFALLLHRRQDDFRKQMSEVPGGRVTTGNAEGVNWIRTDSVFVTVVSKDHEASTIPNRLLAALEAWDPTPHRLIMSKMRCELDQNGAAAETGVLGNHALQAGWLKEILEPDEAKRRTNVRLNVTRHWESLGGRIEPTVVDFAERIATCLLKTDAHQRVLERFDHHGVYKRQEEEVYLQLNCHACSKPVEGHHLSTGHVLKLKLAKNSYQYWLCLTPACDLVPGQGDNKGWKKRLGSWMPFKAVRLYHADKLPALKNATRGYHLFLQVDNKLEAFGLAENAEGQDGGAPALRWEQFFAADNGKFDSSNELKVECIGNNGTLDHEKYDAMVVAQLRYEYALNLMHRLGAHLSRVGLDFSPYGA